MSVWILIAMIVTAIGVAYLMSPGETTMVLPVDVPPIPETDPGSDTDTDDTDDTDDDGSDGTPTPVDAPIMISTGSSSHEGYNGIQVIATGIAPYDCIVKAISIDGTASSSDTAGIVPVFSERIEGTLALGDRYMMPLPANGTFEHTIPMEAVTRPIVLQKGDTIGLGVFLDQNASATIGGVTMALGVVPTKVVVIETSEVMAPHRAGKGATISAVAPLPAGSSIQGIRFAGEGVSTGGDDTCGHVALAIVDEEKVPGTFVAFGKWKDEVYFHRSPRFPKTQGLVDFFAEVDNVQVPTGKVAAIARYSGPGCGARIQAGARMVIHYTSMTESFSNTWLW
jgi:hypothetical protein